MNNETQNNVKLSPAAQKHLENLYQRLGMARSSVEEFMNYLYNEHGLNSDEWVIQNTAVGFQKREELQES